MIADFDAIVLAGGRGSRLGGVNKPEVTVGGRRLLDIALSAVSGARRVVVVGEVEVPDGVLLTREDPPFGGPVAGVEAGFAALAGPHRHPGLDPGGCEVAADRDNRQPGLDPGGSVAADRGNGHPGLDPGGSAAADRGNGHPGLDPGSPAAGDPHAPWILLLASDLPDAESAVAVLLRAEPEPGHDGACLLDTDGRHQWLLGCYRSEALARRLGERGDPPLTAMWRLLEPLSLLGVDPGGAAVADLDTPEDAARWSGIAGEVAW